ncbi:MAG: FkbM family methyltransferase [Gammaproteobacteria bacterium]
MNKPLIPMLVKWFDPLVCSRRWEKLESVLEELAGVDDFFFIQVGANDGIVHDPLYRHVLQNRWNGILIEPVRYYFELLKRNYSAGNHLIFENVAISERDGYRELFRIREGLDFLPQWTKGLGSFNRDVLMKHRWAIPDIQQYIVRETVQCLSLASLLARYAVERIDLIMIDTEGYDFEIIKQIDSTAVWPRVMIYEHKHLARDERLQCERLLSDRNYRLHKHFGNTLAERIA